MDTRISVDLINRLLYYICRNQRFNSDTVDVNCVPKAEGCMPISTGMRSISPLRPSPLWDDIVILSTPLVAVEEVRDGNTFLEAHLCDHLTFSLIERDSSLETTTREKS